MIDVGEYVRTNKGIIGKVLGIYPGHRLANYHIQFQKGVTRKRQYLSDKTIVNHSKKIIDLIEEGDFLEILADGELFRFEVDSIDYKHKLKNIAVNIKVKSIVTKEQYKQIEYIVEE